MDIKKTDLQKIAKHLRAALNIVEMQLDPIEVPAAVQAEVDRKLRERICLAWDHPIPEGEQVRRGNCNTDYTTTMAQIRRGEVSEREMIMQGKLTAEPKKGGRKSAREIAAELAQAAEEKETYHEGPIPKD